MKNDLSIISSVAVSFICSVSLVALLAAGQGPDWKAVGAEGTQLLQQYVRIDTSNPPGDTRKTADLLASVFEREGIPVTRYESAPGKAIIYARLKATATPVAGKAIVLLHHMDVVPADRSHWKVDPFAATIADGEMRARGAFDMKGVGVAHIMAFLMLKRQHVPLSRDVILLAKPDEEIGGAMGARWMIAHHFAELDPAFVIDEGGFGSLDLFAPGKLVYGISVAEKKILWLKVRATGVAGHGSQPNDQNPNDRLVRALAHLLAEPLPGPSATSVASGVMATMQERVGTFAVEQVHERDPALDDRGDDDPIGSRRSAEGERDPVGRRGDARLPRAARHDPRSVARGHPPASRRSVAADRGDQRVGRSCRVAPRTPRSIGIWRRRFTGAIPMP